MVWQVWLFKYEDTPAPLCDFHTPGLVLRPVGPPHEEPVATTTLPAGTGVKDAEAVGQGVGVRLGVAGALGVGVGVGDGLGVGTPVDSEVGVRVLLGVPVAEGVRLPVPLKQ